MLPSLVCRISLSSLNVRRSFTASALTIAKRVFSWITRSKSGMLVFSMTRGAASRFAALAAIVPRDHEAVDDVQSAESDAEQCVRGRERHERCSRAEEHEADAELRHDADRVRAAADER